ncbi:porin [Myxococcaceae bacterium GXIMD 01537]
MKKTLSLVTLFAAGASQAAGFAIDTHSAKATGMGLGTTTIEDASAVYYNPANILAVKQLDIRVGDSPIMPNVKFTRENGSPEGQNRTIAPPFHLFAAYRFADKAVFGLGVYTPFGASSNWVEDFSGRFKGYKSGVQTFNFNPTLAYQLHESFRIGAGLQVMRGVLDLERKLDFVTSEGSVHVGGAAWGFGGTLGAQAEIIEKKLSAGVTYRSPVKIGAEGSGDFKDIPLEFQGRLKDQPISVEVTLPGSVSAGLSYKPMERLTVAVEANWVQWSSFKEFAINFENPELNNPLPKRWKDTWNYRIGAEYGVTEALNVRAGFAYDPAPTPAWTLTPDLPDANRTKVSVGVGYALGGLRADLGYQYVILGEKVSTAAGARGTYSGDAHVGAITLGYSR